MTPVSEELNNKKTRESSVEKTRHYINPHFLFIWLVLLHQWLSKV